MKMRSGFKTATAYVLVLVLLMSLMIFPDYGYGKNDLKYMIGIKTVNGKYFSVKDGGTNTINAASNKIGEWETFEVIDLGKGYIALKSNNGDYVSVSKDGNNVYANSDKIGKRETFQFVPLKNNKVAFKTYDNKYICAEDGGGGKVVANRSKIDSWETFELVRIEPIDKLKLSAESDEKGVTLSWNKPVNVKNIIGYHLYRSTSSGKQSSTPITDFPIKGTSYTDYNIDSGTTYYYILKVVYKGEKLGTASNEVSIVLKPKITLRSETADDGVQLYWNKPTDSKGLIGYYLYRSTASGKQSNTPVTDFPIEGTSYLDKNLESNTVYYYILKPVYRNKTLGTASNETSVKSGSRTTKIVLEVGSRYMYVNGQRKEIDPGKGTEVIIKNGRTFLPIRAVIEAMGGEVDWRQSDQRVSISLKNSKIHLWIGNKIAMVNGKNKETDVAPYISDSGRTMLPLRFIAENLDCEVDWDGLTMKVTITMVR